MTLEIRHFKGGLVFKVKAAPNAGKSSLAGTHNGAVKIKIGAQPEKGKANKELVGFLSGLLPVRKVDIEVVKGASGRDKEVLVKNIGEIELRRILNG